MPPVLLGRSLLAYLVPYGVTVCVADPKRVSTLLAHVAERHRRAEWVLGGHSVTSSARASS